MGLRLLPALGSDWLNSNKHVSCVWPQDWREADEQSEVSSLNKAPPLPWKVSAGNAGTTPSGACGSVQFSRLDSATPWPAARQVSLSITNSRGELKLMSTESAMSSNHLLLCRPLPLLPSIFPIIRVWMSQLFASGSRSTGVSASTAVLQMNIQDWFPLGWTGWIVFLSKGFSRVFSNTTVQKHQLFGDQLSLWSNSHIHTWPLEKPQRVHRTSAKRDAHLLVPSNPGE